jgi:hypothetical protein
VEPAVEVLPGEEEAEDMVTVVEVGVLRAGEVER